MSLVFFDVDHTITRHSTSRHYAIEGIRKGLFPFSLLLIIPLYYLYYRYGNMTIKFFEKEFLFMKGIPRKTFEEIADLNFKRRVRRDIYSRAVSHIKKLRASGRRVVFATSAPDVVVKPLARFLGVVEVLATTLEFKGGISTGRFQGSPLFHQEKRNRVLRYIKEQGFRPEDCSFYSDSIHDLPLLKAVGMPVAVNPDLRLRLTARRRGWKILKFS